VRSAPSGGRASCGFDAGQNPSSTASAITAGFILAEEFLL
jgi:hypothetical protein